METINLNLIPSGIMPVCHASQYDKKRWIDLRLYDGQTPFTITGSMTFELQLRKPDNTIVTESAELIPTLSSNSVEFPTSEQMTAVFGEVLCQLRIKDGTADIGTINFIMVVEPDVLANGDPSQSVIADLDTQVHDLVVSELDPYKYFDYTATLTAGSTSVDIITPYNPPFDSSTVTFFWFTSEFGVNPTNIAVFDVVVGDDSKVVFSFTFEAQASDVDVKVRAYPNS